MIADETAGAGSCHDILIRRQGDWLSVSLHCQFDKQMSIVETHDVTTRIEEKLREQIPDLDRILVHAEPTE